MDDSLIQLMEELVASIERREASDPDAPAWEAERRIKRLEEELTRRVAGGFGAAALAVAAPDEALAGIA